MKYIAYEMSLHPTIVMFAKGEDHADMAFRLGIETSDIIGAGFVTMGDDGLYCHGKSNALDIVSRGTDDTRLLKLLMR